MSAVSNPVRVCFDLLTIEETLNFRVELLISNLSTSLLVVFICSVTLIRASFLYLIEPYIINDAHVNLLRLPGSL